MNTIASILLATLLFASSLAHAETVIARDSNNSYQKNPHSKLKRVLLYDRNIAHESGKKAVRASMARLAARYGFQLDVSDAPVGYLTATTLTGVDVLVLSQGEQDVLGSVGSESDSAVKNFIYRDGKSLLMIHGAAAFIPCPGVGNGGAGENVESSTCRFLARAAARQYYRSQNGRTPMRVYVDSVASGEVPPYAGLGGTVIAPPATNSDHGIRNADTRNIFTGMPRVVDSLKDEWWSFSTSPRLVGEVSQNHNGTAYLEGEVNVLLSLDETSRDIGQQRMGDHPIAWTRKMGNGLAAVNTAGHDSISWVQADSVLEKFNGRLLRYLARDFVGCMNPASLHYNPEATVTSLTASDSANPCDVVSFRPTPGERRPGYAMTARSGNLRIDFHESGTYDVSMKDVAGRQVFSGAARGGMRVEGLKPGIYFLSVSAPDGSKTARRVILF